jgi:ElaA protein
LSSGVPIHFSVKQFSSLTASELYDIIQLRIAVFVIEQNCPYQDADGKDQHSLHVMGRNDNGVLVCYARIVLPGVSYEEVSIGRVVTSKEVRGSGVGKLLMQFVMKDIAKQFNNPPIRISAQSYLQKFYEDYGFVVQGEEYLEDDIPHKEMLFKQSKF